MSKSKIKFELDKEGVKELLKSSEMDGILSEKAAAITTQLSGYESDLHHFKNRDAIYVYPATEEAKKDNWDNHTLTRLL